MSVPPTIVVEAVLGAVTERRWAARARDPVDVAWGDAGKHRRIVRSASGREVALRLPRGTFLADGAVLADDGATVVVVRRPPEPAVVVPLTGADGADGDRVRAALLLGYLLGNRHAPLDLESGELRTPLMTSPATARSMLADLGLPGCVRDVPLAPHGWSGTSADHREGHAHEHG
ncbi:MAG: urease accessory protein UreE [Actinomycetota bacterium]|nr:urease accessory protein UreE [Actinomycetota bacterium]